MTAKGPWTVKEFDNSTGVKISAGGIKQFILVSGGATRGENLMIAHGIAAYLNKNTVPVSPDAVTLEAEYDQEKNA